MKHSGLTIDEDVTSLFMAMGIIGGFLLAVAILGIVGMNRYYKVRSLGKIILRLSSVFMLVMLVANILMFAVVGYYATQIDVLIDEDWAKVEDYVAAKKSGSLANDTRVAAILDETFHNETKAEFVETVKGSFSILMLTGAIITVILLSGVIAAHFLVKTNNPIPGSKDSGGGGSGVGDGESKEGAPTQKAPKPGKGASKEEKAAYKAAKKVEKEKLKEKKQADTERLQEEAKRKKLEKVKDKIEENDGEVEQKANGNADDNDTGAQTVENPITGSAEGAAANPFEKEGEQAGDKKPKKKDKKKKKNKNKKPQGNVSASQKDKEEQARLQALWIQIDVDGSGALDRSEVAQVLESMGRPIDDAGLDAAMFDIDVDGSGEVEFAEFLEWWQGQDPEAQKQLMLLQEINFDDL